MPVAERILVLEISCAPGGDAVVAYGDAVLDHATRLVLSGRTRNLSAEVMLDGTRVVFRCGSVGPQMAQTLAGLDRVIFARLEGTGHVAVVERPLEHV